MGRKPDPAKARYWQRTIGEAARSGLSAQEFCRRRGVNVTQFYSWRHRLKPVRQAQPAVRRPDRGPATFALVSEEARPTDGGIELVLGAGRLLRISRGVDEGTLRAVLAALERPGC